HRRVGRQRPQLLQGPQQPRQLARPERRQGGRPRRGPRPHAQPRGPPRGH
ncbi:hypothetical protein BN1723_019483, partial [Verticillium longisporum]